MIEKLNLHYSFTNPASVHDEEALTALELAGRQGAKINEVVTAQNNLRTETENHLAAQDAAIPGIVAEDVKKHIEDGAFDDQIAKANDEFVSEVQSDLRLMDSRLSLLTGKLSEGGTTMDAEIIDARVGENGKTYANLGNAIRGQFQHTMTTAAPGAGIDANTLLEPGVYMAGGSDAWTNIPDGMNAGAIVVMNDPTYPARLVQLAVAYAGGLSVRNYNGTKFSDWVNAAKQADTEAADSDLREYIDNLKTLHCYKNPSDEPVDIDNYTETGMYFFGSSHDMTNAPTKNGLLVVYKGEAAHNIYQVWHDYWGKTYRRNFVYNSGWRDWDRIAQASEITEVVETEGRLPEYSIEKVDDNSAYVYKRTTRGYVRYELYHAVDANVNLDTYCIGAIDVCDKSKNVVKNVLTRGMDIEGVVLLDGESDHIGGVHGDEVAASFMLLVDGVPVTFADLTSQTCDEVKLSVGSWIYHQDAEKTCIWREKLVVFSRYGLDIHNRWEFRENNLRINSVRACMMSVNKDCITHYFDNAVHLTPAAVPETTTDSGSIRESDAMSEVWFFGDVNIYHKAIIPAPPAPVSLEYTENGDPFIDATPEYQNNGFIHDYGARLKSYFTTMNGYMCPVDTKLKTVNHIEIIY